MKIDSFARFEGVRRKVARIGFGLGLGGYFQRRLDASQFEESLKFSIELGNNHIDSAQNYGDGQSEEIIGSVAREMRAPLLVATKIGPADFSDGKVIPAIENSLRRLNMESIPLLYLHWPNPTIALDTTLSQIQTAYEQGKIQGLGLSNFSIPDIKRTRDYLSGEIFRAIQLEYNLFDRTPELDFFPLASSLRLSVVAYSPLDQGKVLGSQLRRRRIDKLARSQGITAGQLALSWLLVKSHCFLIPSTRNKGRVRENYGALDIELSDDVFHEVEEITKPEVVRILPQDIQVATDPSSRRDVYLDVKSARENLAGYTPSPEDVALALGRGEKVKPIRVLSQPRATPPYVLVEGRVRFWAHVIAFGFSTPIEALVRD